MNYTVMLSHHRSIAALARVVFCHNILISQRFQSKTLYWIAKGCGFLLLTC